MINGVLTNLQAPYNPMDVRGLNPLEKLNFFSDMANSMTKAWKNSAKVQQSVIDNEIKAMKEIN